MQGEADKHLQEGNLAKLENVRIELMKSDGEVLGTIENLNFLEESREAKEPTIGEMLDELESDPEVTENTVANVCSMKTERRGC